MSESEIEDTSPEDRPNYSDRDSWIRRKLATAQHEEANARDWDDPRSRGQALRDAKAKLERADDQIIEQIRDLNRRIEACEAEVEELENDD